MSWRKRFLLWFGPSTLGGITFGDWLALLRENRFAVDPSYWLRATTITLCSLGNSLDRRREEASYGQAIRDAIVDPPVFVLGIWRSGTTHLQNLFAVDERFAFPNWYQVAYPHSFLGTEAKRSRFLGFFIPETRVQDNMKYGLMFPAEDEFALCTTSARSPLMSNAKIDHWYDVARKNGALGGKLIGAGGGGFLLFLCEERGRLREAMAEEGLEEIRFRFDFEGTKVLN